MTRRDLLQLTALALPATASAARSARLRTAICAYSFREALGAGELTYEDLVEMAVENDVDGLDLTVYWFPAEKRDDFLMSLRRKAYLNAVEIPSIAIRTDLCRKSPREQEREAAWVHYWVDVADRLGSSHIRIFGGNVPDGATEKQAAGWVAEILARSADYAGSKGVILGLENHGGITLRAERIVEIVESVDHPFVGINLDTGNFRSDIYEQIEMCAPHAVNTQFKVHVTDEGKKMDSDWERVVEILKNAGYRGYMALEYEAEEDPMTAVPKHLARLNRLAG